MAVTMATNLTLSHTHIGSCRLASTLPWPFTPVHTRRGCGWRASTAWLWFNEAQTCVCVWNQHVWEWGFLTNWSLTRLSLSNICCPGFSCVLPTQTGYCFRSSYHYYPVCWFTVLGHGPPDMSNTRHVRGKLPEDLFVSFYCHMELFVLFMREKCWCFVLLAI